MNTIIYFTDNSLEEKLAQKCREVLKKEAQDIPIVSVSQKSIDLGKNICVGEIGRSWLSLYKQVLAGAEAAETPHVVMAEHDCMYTHEHLGWTPPNEDVFYYNHNHWLVWWADYKTEINGMYSYWPGRYALSQLVCSRELLIKSIKERLAFLENGYIMVRGLRGAGEPGVADEKAIMKAQSEATSGRPTQLQRYLKGCLTEYRSDKFMTVNPNLDIRHGHNFTGPKRGKNRTYSLPYWGKFEI